MQKKSELESNIKYNNKVSSEMSNLLQNFKSIKKNKKSYPIETPNLNNEIQ